MTGYARALREAITLGMGNPTNNNAALTAVHTWMLACPVADHTTTNNYYEDIVATVGNYVNTDILEQANYLLDFPAVDGSNTLADAISLWNFCNTQLGQSYIGSSTAISEQISFNFSTPDATSRFALVALKINQAGGAASYKDVAFRSLNWITYMLKATSGANNGQVQVIPAIDNFWYRVSVETVLHMSQASAIAPEWFCTGSVCLSGSVLGGAAVHGGNAVRQ